MPRSKARVGFIGLGIMGAPMAGRLLDAGHAVSVFNRTAAKGDALVARGARRAATPRDAAAGADVVISIVTDGPDVEEVLFGRDGAAEGAGPGTLFIDMSTIAPAVAKSVAAALHARGCGFLDAPVTGGDVGAREGTLSILVGGDAADLERARPVFEALGRRVTPCGPVGSGQAMKACNQVLCALNMIGLVEALHLARGHGLDGHALVEALSAGAGGSWALEKLGPRIVRDDFAPGFMVKLLQKDLRIVQDMAAPAGGPLEGTALAQRLFTDNEAHGEGELGTQAMWKALARKRPQP